MLNKRRNIFLFASLFFSLSLFSQQFKVATLNCEWLSCEDFPPTNEALQLSNIAKVIKNVNADIIALQEVGTSASNATIDKLVNILGSGWAGKITPWDADNCSQNQAIIYKTSKIESINSSLIKNGGSYYEWSSGRYPVLYNVYFLTDKGKLAISLINIHAKANGETDSYARRKDASVALKQLFDSSYKNSNIILIGDYNDYLIGTLCSQCSPKDSPYKNFMDDTQNYKGLTQNLRDPNRNNNPVIDNILISNELFENYKEGSALRDVAATSNISNYEGTTSDHYPITVVLQFGNYSDIDEIEEMPQLVVYPNPATDKLKINNEQLIINNVDITDLTGKIIINCNLSIVNSIDVSALSQGIYILKINTEKGIFVRKFVKK